MALNSTKYLLVNFKLFSRCNVYFSTSSCLNRKIRPLPPNPYQNTPITYLPDFSYVDGRPVPLTNMKQKKLKYQESLCEKIVKLTEEVDTAVELHKKSEDEKAQNIRNILNSKLKPKGAALLKKKEIKEEKASQ